MARRRFRFPLTLIAGLMVLVIALLAAGSLWLLHRMQERQTRAAAARSVIQRGMMITSHLARQPAVSAPEPDQDWMDFSRLVQSIYAVERGLQYVSVTHGEVILYHEQAPGLYGDPQTPETTRELLDDVRLGRRRLAVGTRELPVVTFSLDIVGSDGTGRSVEVALRKDTVEREETIPSVAILSMFRLSLVTVLVSFGICVVLVVWMVRREGVRERQRRQEEHLAFAGVMANGIVHDFRNPMSSLRLDTQMLEREALKRHAPSDRLESLARRVRHTADRMDKVFQEFFYLSRPSSDRMERMNVCACVRECLEMLAPRLEQSGIRVQTDLPDPGPEIMAYPGSMRRALVNVLTNGVQFSPPDGTLSVRVARKANMVNVEVADQGAGIPARERKRVFDMFVTSRPGGAGVGLFLARTAVEHCGGTIRALESEGGGTLIVIALAPAAEATPGAGSKPEKEACPPPSGKA